MKIHPGSCHCGGVKFRVTADIAELTTCDCSLCVKKNAVMTKVSEASLEIVEGSDLLSLYEWNGERGEAAETAVVFKTDAALLDRAYTLSLHDALPI